MLFLNKIIKYSVKYKKYIIKRLCHTDFINTATSNTNELVRVRFAPSPTGHLHLGGLRTALYNYLFAKSNNGTFIIRIEDTDQSRLVDGATEKLIKDLEWAGIIPDESPQHHNNVNNKYGPYIQSQRLDIYRNEVKKLLENGNAYYCFCSERRLDLLRKDALKTRQIPKYDNRCRHLTPIQIAEKLANHDTFCIRFKLDPYIDDFNDLVYGKIVYNVADNEGDPVIIKSDGYPTYHFANVVDDHLMDVTHVLRGVEWQISTTKHLLLYKAFGWVPPKYGHLPLLLNSDGTKLSKRQSNINIDYYRDKGIFPQALINYITQSGGGFDKQQLQKPKSYSMNELQQMFDLKKINENSSRLNPDLLDECNRLEIIENINDPQKCDVLIAEVKRLIMQVYPNSINALDLDHNHIKNILKWSSTRLTSINKLVDGNLSFLWILPKETVENNLNTELQESLLKELETHTFQKHELQIMLKEFSRKNNLKFNNFMKTLRSLLSGLKEGPAVAEMMEILGKQITIQRIILKKKSSESDSSSSSKT